MTAATANTDMTSTRLSTSDQTDYYGRLTRRKRFLNHRARTDYFRKIFLR
jgi:hypothetical protein